MHYLGIDWKVIKGFEDYAINKKGRIKRIKDADPQSRAKAGKNIKSRVMQSGYVYVTLFKDSKRKDFRLHRLVAENFIGPCPKGYEVNHKDANKLNNFYKNLEYMTNKENKEHAKKLGLFLKGEEVGISKLNKHQVKAIRLVYAVGAVSSYKIAKIFDVEATTILSVLKRKTWKHV